ncbi:MAG: FRG domain-containing protein [Pseudomonadota bacterium]
MTIMDLQSFIGEINGEPNDDQTVTVYRGHPNQSYTLKPTIFRSAAHTANEHLLLRDLVAMHPDQFASDTSALEMLVRMQHYSLPTRLLDATWNPLVSLYFAVQPKKVRVLRTGTKIRVSREADGEVVRFIVDKKLVRYFDSDTVSCIANLARGDEKLKEDIRDLLADKRCSDAEAGIAWFNGERPIKRLLHFISGEKPAFAPDIVPSHLSRVFLVKPKLSNRRILAQEGCFFAFGLTDNIPPKGMPGIQIQRIKVPAGDKATVLAQLKRIAINERTMFPEIERAAKYLTDDVTATAILSRT